MKSLEMRMRAKLGPRKEVPKEKQLGADMKWILKKVKTGDLDLTKKSQQIKLGIAIRKGLINKEDIK